MASSVYPDMKSTGVPASFMISQAALETGWGRKEIRHADGSSAHKYRCSSAS